MYMFDPVSDFYFQPFRMRQIDYVHPILMEKHANMLASMSPSELVKSGFLSKLLGIKDVNEAVAGVQKQLQELNTNLNNIRDVATQFQPFAQQATPVLQHISPLIQLLPYILLGGGMGALGGAGFGGAVNRPGLGALIGLLLGAGLPFFLPQMGVALPSWRGGWILPPASTSGPKPNQANSAAPSGAPASQNNPASASQPTGSQPPPAQSQPTGPQPPASPPPGPQPPASPPPGPQPPASPPPAGNVTTSGQSK